LKKSLHSICILAAVFADSPALADDGCGRFAWSVAQQRAALTAPGLPMVPSGSAIDPAQIRAFRLALRDPAEANFVMPPERKPRVENGRGGVVHLPAPPRAGLYQLTLSDEAWVDIVQDGRYARSVGSSGRNDCPGVRKTVRFDLSDQPLVIQVSGTAAHVISLIFGPAR
jgi:hypothetical protein